MSLIPDDSIMEGRYLRDILDQPRALRETLEALDASPQLERLTQRFKDGEFQRIVLTGMGSSFHALYPLNLELVEQAITAVMVETSELVHYKKSLFDSHTLIVAVSQSGRSAEILRLLEINRHNSALIAVTNTLASPLAGEADAVLATKAGEEFSVSCKTYITALMALQWLADALCQKDMRRTRRDLALAASASESYLEKWKQHTSSLADLLEGTRHLFLVGRGASLAAVGTGALIIKEADHFHAEGMSSAAFRHGPFEMLHSEIFVLVFSGDPQTRALNRRLFDDIREGEGKAALLGSDAKLDALR
ncbi:MAG: SIS domain-containing protein, partial [Blastocatellia bacterium]